MTWVQVTMTQVCNSLYCICIHPHPYCTSRVHLALLQQWEQWKAMKKTHQASTCIHHTDDSLARVQTPHASPWHLHFQTTSLLMLNTWIWILWIFTYLPSNEFFKSKLVMSNKKTGMSFSRLGSTSHLRGPLPISAFTQTQTPSVNSACLLCHLDFDRIYFMCSAVKWHTNTITHNQTTAIKNCRPQGNYARAWSRRHSTFPCWCVANLQNVCITSILPYT